MKNTELFMRLLHRNVNKDLGKEVPRKEVERALLTIFIGLTIIIAILVFLIYL